MSVPLSYATVIIIWSTTPLGIQWSGEQVGYEFGIALRMLIGLVLLSAIVWLRGLPLSLDRHSLRIYLLGGVPMFVAMSSVYWSAQFIPSGWISVVFGFSPIMTSLLATLLLGERAFADGKLAGMLFGLAGLAVVFGESIELGEQAWMGVAGVLLSVLAHSSSAVLLKRAQPGMPALSITAGSLLVAMPLFMMNLLLGPGLPQEIPSRALLAIVYLGVVGTSIGFPLYYYLLTRLPAGKLALITLITPVTALLLGAWFNGEIITSDVWIGTALIVSGLGLYEFGHRLKPLQRAGRRLSLRWWQRPM